MRPSATAATTGSTATPTGASASAVIVTTVSTVNLDTTAVF